MSPKTEIAIVYDDASFFKLLDESHQFLEEGRKEEQEQEELGKPSWTDRFNTRIKTSFGAFASDTFGEVAAHEASCTHTTSTDAAGELPGAEEDGGGAAPITEPPCGCGSGRRVRSGFGGDHCSVFTCSL